MCVCVCVCVCERARPLSLEMRLGKRSLCRLPLGQVCPLASESYGDAKRAIPSLYGKEEVVH